MPSGTFDHTRCGETVDYRRRLRVRVGNHAAVLKRGRRQGQPGLSGGREQAGVCAAAPIVDISTAITTSFFIVAPFLLLHAIKDVPDFSVLAFGNEEGAVRGLRQPSGRANALVGLLGILACETAGKDLEFARRLAVVKGLEGHIARRLR